MSTLEQAARQALEALEYIENNYMSLPKIGNNAISALRTALEQQAQAEPAAWPMETQPDGTVNPVDPGDMTPEQRAYYTRPQPAEPAAPAIPDTLKKLGKRLAELLDEAQWAECEVLLLATALALAQPARESLEKAYRAGFEASDEGYNAEYPFGDNGQNPEHEENWLKNRDEALASLAQPAAQWVGLTDEDIQLAVTQAVQAETLSWLGFQEDGDGNYTVPLLSPSHYQFARAIEAKLREKNGGAK